MAAKQFLTQLDILAVPSLNNSNSGFISLGAKSDGLYQKNGSGSDTRLATTLDLSNYLPLSGGTLTGLLTANSGISSTTGTFSGSLTTNGIYNPNGGIINVFQIPGQSHGNLGNPYVDEMAVFAGQFTNKLRFIPAISQEETSDGSTWTTSTKATPQQLANIMIGGGQTDNILIIPSGAQANTGYRLTWYASQTDYVYLNYFYSYLCTCGQAVNIKIEQYSLNTNSWTTVSNGSANGWPLHFSMKHGTIPFHPTANDSGHFSQVRVTFSLVNASQNYGIYLYAIEWFGGYPSGIRTVETYDSNKNTYFPEAVSATYFVGGGSSLTSLPTNTSLYPTLNQNTTGTASNITSYPLNQSVSTTSSPSFNSINSNDGTSRISIQQSGGTGYIEAGNSAWTASAPLQICGYNTNNLTSLTIKSSSTTIIGGLLTANNGISSTTGTFSSNISTGGRLFSNGQTSPNLHLDPTAGNNSVYLSFYQGTGGTKFGNGASGVVASIDGSGALSATTGTFSGSLKATEIYGKSDLSNQQAPLNYIYIGSTDDAVTDSVILLHPAYNGTAINKYLFDGIITFQRGSNGAYNISDNYEVKTSTAYITNTGSIISRNTAIVANLVTCTYNSVLYVAIYVPKTAFRTIYYKGELLSTLPAPLVLLASSVTNVTPIVQDSTNIGGLLTANNGLTVNNALLTANNGISSTTGTFSGTLTANSISATIINGYKSNNLIIENESGSLLASNTISGNLTGFGYTANGWPTNGSFISFGSFGTESYITQIQGQYGGSGNNLFFRTVNNDNGTVNPWYTIYNSGNFNNSSTPIIASTGTFSGLLTASSGLTVTGNIQASGEVTAYTTSDKRLKKNIKTIDNALDVINKIRPVSFNWNDKAKELNSSKTDIIEFGIIAQELEKILPNTVKNMYDGKYKGINYIQIIPYLVAAIQELTEEINILKNK